MACIPAAARKQASCHLVVGPVIQEKSAQQYLTFSLSIVHIRTEDCKVLNGGVSRRAMRLASTAFWYHSKHCCCLTEEYERQGTKDRRAEVAAESQSKKGG